MESVDGDTVVAVVDVVDVDAAGVVVAVVVGVEVVVGADVVGGDEVVVVVVVVAVLMLGAFLVKIGAEHAEIFGGGKHVMLWMTVNTDKKSDMNESENMVSVEKEAKAVLDAPVIDEKTKTTRQARLVVSKTDVGNNQAGCFEYCNLEVPSVLVCRGVGPDETGCVRVER